jgi:hypothetical protein
MDEKLQNAVARLQRGRFLVREQKARVARLAARGLPIEQSTSLLDKMEAAVAGFEHYLSLHGWNETS